jgi:hypothetical protein
VPPERPQPLEPSCGSAAASGSGVKADEQLWSLDPTGDGCRFTFDEHAELAHGSLGSVLGVIGERGLTSHVAEMLVRLKRVAEA